MSLNGQTQTYMPPTLDGLNIVEADQIYVDGVELDPANIVPYTGANKTLNMGSQAIKTSYTPVANADVVNLLALQNAILYVEGVNVANFVKYTGSNQNVDLGSNNLTVGNTGLTSFSNVIKTELNNVLAGYTPASITVGNNFGTITNAGGVYQATSNATFASLVLGAPPSGEKYIVSLSLKSVDVNNNTNLFLYGSTTANMTGSTGMITSFSIPPNTTGFTVFTNTITFPVGSTYLLLVYSSQKLGGIDTLYWDAFTMTGVGSVVKNLIAPTSNLDGTNKGYVDSQDSLRVPYTGAASNVNIGSNNIIANTAQFTGITSATPALALGVDGSGNLRSFAVPSATNLLPLNNTWTGTNTFNNNVVMGDTYTTNVNNAFASNQTPIANATNLATGGTDFTGAMPVCVLTKPSYYNLAGAGTLAMSVGLDLGYTGGSFTAGASTTISGSWTANTVSNRIATITFDVSAHIGKSLRCVWEGLTPLVFATSPPPFFTVVNGATTVYSSPQPISGTNTYAWNFTPTVGTTTITYTVQTTGTPSIAAFSWTGFSIKQIGASRLAYKTGAKYTATFTNMIASQNMSFSVYQYTTAGGTPLAISDISNIPITTSGQTIIITFNVNIFPTNLGTVVFFFQPSSTNQYVRFDSMTLTRADMTISGNILSSVIATSSVVSSNPSGNSGNGTVMNMTAFNGAFGSLEVYDNVNATSANKLPLALQAYGGNVGIGLTNPTQKLQVAGRGCFGYIPSSKRGIFIDNEDSYGTNPCIQGVDTVFGASAITINPAGGYVAIGKTVPTQALDVSGNGARIQVESNTTSNAVVQIKTNSDTSYMFTNQSGHLEMYPGNIDKRLLFQGVADISGGDNYAVANGYMQTGSLTIGDPRRNYGGSSSFWTSNTAGLMMECLDNTEISVHDSGIAVMSFMYYSGSVFTIGRNMGWGLSNTRIAGQLQVRNNMTLTNGDDSFCYYGANATWGATLCIGSGTNKGGCQVFTTDGNLHIDALNGHAIYYGYYPNAAGNPNPHYFYGSDIRFQSSLPEQNAAYCYPVCLQGTQLFRSQCMQRRVYSNNSVAWTGGTNITYAFYKNTSNVVVKISGKLSYYVGGNTRAYPYVRTYSQSWGTYTYWSLEAFTNVGSNHTTFPFEIVLSYNDLSSPYWHDVYVYNAANCISDTNDQLWVNIEILPMGDY